jgi:hypothetical protein
MNTELTIDKQLLNSEQYQKIKDVIGSLARSEGLQSFFGNCVASADIIQTMLSRSGIASKILECQVCVIKSENGMKNFLFVGYDNYSYPGQIDTHTVVITEDENPIMIDVSLGHVLPTNHQIIVEKANGLEPGVIADFTIGNTRVTYSEKKNLRLAQVHQKNLLQRMIAEQNTEKTLKVLRTLILVAVTMSLINFTMNILLIILRLFDITWV